METGLDLNMTYGVFKSHGEILPALRQQVEEVIWVKATQSSKGLEALPSEETRRMVLDLRMHQVELEMQNEELRRAQMKLDAARARYFDLYDPAPVAEATNTIVTRSPTGRGVHDETECGFQVGREQGGAVRDILRNHKAMPKQRHDLVLVGTKQENPTPQAIAGHASAEFHDSAHQRIAVSKGMLERSGQAAERDVQRHVRGDAPLEDQ